MKTAAGLSVVAVLLATAVSPLTAARYRVREAEARVSTEVAAAAGQAAARFATLDDAQEAVRQAQEVYRKYRDVQFGLIGARPVVGASELLTAVQALNQARVTYLQQVVEFNRQQFRQYTAMGKPAVCGVE